MKQIIESLLFTALISGMGHIAMLQIFSFKKKYLEENNDEQTKKIQK